MGLWLNLVAEVFFNTCLVMVIVQAFRNQFSIGDVTLYSTAVTRIQFSLTSIVLALSSKTVCSIVAEPIWKGGRNSIIPYGPENA